MSKHKLLQKEFSLGSFLNSIQIGILFLDENYKIDSPNKACINLFGYNVEELKSIPFTNLLTDKSRKNFIDLFEYLIKEKRSNDEEVFEASIINSSGEKIPVELNINSTLTNSDNLYIIVLNDIFKRKQLEEEIEHQIEDKEEIKEKLEKTQELSELKSRFVTMASHEFRTPLAGVLSSVNLIDRYLTAEEKSGTKFLHLSKIENHFNKIRESVGNLTQILNEFLSVGKLEEGKISCQWEAVELRELIKGLVENFQRLSKTDQEVVSNVQLKRKDYLLDLSMIRNVLNNLISNAIKYSDKGQTIRIDVVEKEEFISIEVKDEGLGIPKEDQAKLFGRFFRAKNATNIQGTGLGLHIVKQYVEMMDGSISFRSELNQGTTFIVLIPIKNEV